MYFVLFSSFVLDLGTGPCYAAAFGEAYPGGPAYLRRTKPSARGLAHRYKQWQEQYESV